MTGFHKRKVQRRKLAEEQKAKQEREKKLEGRREVHFFSYTFFLLAHFLREKKP